MAKKDNSSSKVEPETPKKKNVSTSKLKKKKPTTSKTKAKPKSKPEDKAAPKSKSTDKSSDKSKSKSTDKSTDKTKAKSKTKPEAVNDEKTFEEELEEQLSDAEIENFQIEKVDMEKLTKRVCDILADRESDGMLQIDLWKKLKLTNRDGSRLSLKLERMGTITREKILENGRWTYKLILKKTPISTQSLENAPCLVCAVEQKCTLEGEISPRNCQLIEDWVIAEIKKPKKSK